MSHHDIPGIYEKFDRTGNISDRDLGYLIEALTTTYITISTINAGNATKRYVWDELEAFKHMQETRQALVNTYDEDD